MKQILTPVSIAFLGAKRGIREVSRESETRETSMRDTRDPSAKTKFSNVSRTGLDQVSNRSRTFRIRARRLESHEAHQISLFFKVVTDPCSLNVRS